MDINKKLVEEFKIKPVQVENTVKLIDEGNTIPFIARYRKELTGSLDDQLLRELHERLIYLRNLDEKREQVRASILEQEKMTDEINKSLDNATSLTEIDDIYRPFRPKRRTRATIAVERGLEKLGLILFEQELTQEFELTAKEFINPELEVLTVVDAVNGAKDIVAEMISDEPKFRTKIRNLTFEKGIIESKGNEKEKSVYEMYYNFSEPIKKIAGHRILAINRGEKEKFLKVTLQAPIDEILRTLEIGTNKKNKFSENIINEVIEDSYKRLIAPSIEREIRNELTEKAEEGAIKVFGENLKQLLLQPPIKGRFVLALDPGFRTGCKMAAIDDTGKVLTTGVVYCTPPASKIEESKAKLIPIIKKFNIDIIAIGNGTASRETESFVAEMLKEIDREINYIVVNESGASIYSASKLGAEEFPEYDVALRSAVSIARRLQDPLAELVKIDPQSIGVGQYQHDMNQKRLSGTLSGVVESCVNSVGIDLNTASASLLSYVAGVNASVAKNIIAYREEEGAFTSRKELLKVKKLGPSAFLQCAGFLRVPESKNPLDNTGVHPESYKVTEKMLKEIGLNMENIHNNELNDLGKKVENIDELASKLEVGVPTLKDIIKELEKPGRDPREDMPLPILRSDVLEMEHLQEGMILKGTVRNVIDFGAFVDIGVHQDGLVHISQMTNRYIKHPLEVVSVGDIIDVSVLSVDVERKKIALTMKIKKDEK